MLMNNAYFNHDKSMLVVTDEQFKPVVAFSGQIARRKYQQFKQRTAARPLSRKDLQTELDLCRSVLLNAPDLPPDIRADYQKRYRTAKKQLEQIENSLIKS